MWGQIGQGPFSTDRVLHSKDVVVSNNQRNTLWIKGFMGKMKMINCPFGSFRWIDTETKQQRCDRKWSGTRHCNICANELLVFDFLGLVALWKWKITRARVSLKLSCLWIFSTQMTDSEHVFWPGCSLVHPEENILLIKHRESLCAPTRFWFGQTMHDFVCFFLAQCSWLISDLCTSNCVTVNAALQMIRNHFITKHESSKWFIYGFFSLNHGFSCVSQFSILGGKFLPTTYRKTSDEAWHPHSGFTFEKKGWSFGEAAGCVASKL